MNIHLFHPCSRPRILQFTISILLLGTVAANHALAQFETISPIVLPAERALNPQSVFSAERMEQQMNVQQQNQMLRNELQDLQRTSAMQTNLLSQTPEQPAALSPMIPTTTPAPGSNPGNWIELDAPLRVTNNNGVFEGGLGDTGNANAPGTFDQGNGEGFVFAEGHEGEFWEGLDCDCRKCRRKFLGGKFWHSCCKPEFGGWLAGGYYNNANGTDGSFGNSPLGFNNISGAQLNQAWLYAENPVERGGGWDFGYRLDLVFGADGQDTQAFGDEQWDASWDTSGQYGFALPQLFVEGAYGNTSIRVGHFFTILGFETVTAPDNFLFSHSYTSYYNEPFTHTGILGRHDLSDAWTVHLGYTFGWDTGFSNGNSGATFLGGLSWTPSEYFSITYATSIGDPGDDPVGTSDTYLQSIVVDTMLTDNLEWVVQSDFQNRQSAVLDGQSYGLVNYLFYQLSDRTSLGARYEWFRDSRGLAGLAGASEHFHAITLGLNRSVTDRLLVRPEVRFDWTDRDDNFAGAAFDNGTEDTQLTFGSQAIWTF